MDDDTHIWQLRSRLAGLSRWSMASEKSHVSLYMTSLAIITLSEYYRVLHRSSISRVPSKAYIQTSEESNHT